jgi:hypothetical protein
MDVFAFSLSPLASGDMELQFWDKLHNSWNSGRACLNSSSWLLFCSFLKQQFLLGEAAMMYLEPEHASVWPSQCRCYQVLAPPVIVAGARMEYLIHTSVTSVFSLHIKFA